MVATGSRVSFLIRSIHLFFGLPLFLFLLKSSFIIHFCKLSSFSQHTCPNQVRRFLNYVFDTVLLFCTFLYFINGDVVLYSDVQYCSMTFVFKHAQIFGIKLRKGPRFRSICSNWSYQCIVER